MFRGFIYSAGIVAFIVLCSLSPGHKRADVTEAGTRAKMAPYCAKTHQVPDVWTEVDTNGDANVYGDCVNP